MTSLDDIARGPLRGLSSGHGFRRTRRLATRVDSLVRSVYFHSLFSSDDKVSFDIHFDVGIEGLSSTNGLRGKWIIRAYAGRYLRDRGNLASLAFRRSDSTPLALVELVEGAVRELTSSMLLRYSDAHELRDMVKRNALEFIADPRASNEFSRLNLEPWNGLPRLELAAAYTRFLNGVAESDEITDIAATYAGQNNLSRYMGAFRDSISKIIPSGVL